jgi:hypothetical protein
MSVAGLSVAGLARFRLSVAGLGACLAVADGLAVSGLTRLAAARLPGAWLDVPAWLDRPAGLAVAVLAGSRRICAAELPGGVLRLGAGPLIPGGRDYPGALRRGNILLSQASRGGRLLASGPVRLVPGRDG